MLVEERYECTRAATFTRRATVAPPRSAATRTSHVLADWQLIRERQSIAMRRTCRFFAEAESSALEGTARGNFPKLAIRKGSFAVTFRAAGKNHLALGRERRDEAGTSEVNGLAATSLSFSPSLFCHPLLHTSLSHFARYHSRR